MSSSPPPCSPHLPRRRDVRVEQWYVPLPTASSYLPSEPFPSIPPLRAARFVIVLMGYGQKEGVSEATTNALSHTEVAGILNAFALDRGKIPAKVVVKDQEVVDYLDNGRAASEETVGTVVIDSDGEEILSEGEPRVGPSQHKESILVLNSKDEEIVGKGKGKKVTQAKGVIYDTPQLDEDVVEAGTLHVDELEHPDQDENLLPTTSPHEADHRGIGTGGSVEAGQLGTDVFSDRTSADRREVE
ncbi:hypothetical protein K435DRAFT_859932 [Dendrothele bispora CBS 962.96]|uniref:Uncharacterized protein n=1 Tax=Dendrothele bispora (strain CBS 962.96) TaxID=1314807 RepID=A0A4S8M0H9_DENBC|nr:hypothetical protein K435DRAFT_859932 [Dendrothele bispora CBS 962.96]